MMNVTSLQTPFFTSLDVVWIWRSSRLEYEDGMALMAVRLARMLVKKMDFIVLGGVVAGRTRW